MQALVEKYVRRGRFPHIWCPGCGNGIVMRAFMMAAEEVELDKDRTVLISGIGCSGRITGYLDFNTVHTTHGRALAFATGIKLAKPELTVIVFMGDGDAVAIGGNHFIHAARRNIDLTAIVFNNHVYGMTGGQYSPTTRRGARATTAPYGFMERAFDISGLAIGAGANFVARSTVYHVRQLARLTAQAIRTEGIGVVEVMTYCHVTHGRRNEMPDPMQNMKWLKENSISVEQARREGVGDRTVIGVLADRNYSEYITDYDRLVEELSAPSGREKLDAVFLEHAD